MDRHHRVSRIKRKFCRFFLQFLLPKTLLLNLSHSTPFRGSREAERFYLLIFLGYSKQALGFLGVRSLKQRVRHQSLRTFHRGTQGRFFYWKQPQVHIPSDYEQFPQYPFYSCRLIGEMVFLKKDSCHSLQLHQQNSQA